MAAAFTAAVDQVIFLDRLERTHATSVDINIDEIEDLRLFRKSYAF